MPPAPFLAFVSCGNHPLCPCCGLPKATQRCGWKASDLLGHPLSPLRAKVEPFSRRDFNPMMSFSSGSHSRQHAFMLPHFPSGWPAWLDSKTDSPSTLTSSRSNPGLRGRTWGHVGVRALPVRTASLWLLQEGLHQQAGTCQQFGRGELRPETEQE
jgi:hypothetical protein